MFYNDWSGKLSKIDDKVMGSAGEINENLSKSNFVNFFVNAALMLCKWLT